jgi:6-pyruvoyl-tetrahydropterin synthase
MKVAENRRVCSKLDLAQAVRHSRAMPTENFSNWTIQQLRARLEENLTRIEEADAKGEPYKHWFAENDALLFVLDQLMEQHRGTALYEDYWKSRQIKEKPPIHPPRFGTC